MKKHSLDGKNAALALFIAQTAAIAALYALLTLVGWTFGSMQIQVRLSEALCVLVAFTPAAVPGLFLGCFAANFLAGNVIDALFGSLTTLAAALLSYFLCRAIRNSAKVVPAVLPAIFFNAIAVPLILYYGYGIVTFGEYTGTWAVLGWTALSVLIGQSIACAGLGVPLFFALKAISERVDLFRSKEIAPLFYPKERAEEKPEINRPDPDPVNKEEEK